MNIFNFFCTTKMALNTHENCSKLTLILDNIKEYIYKINLFCRSLFIIIFSEKSRGLILRIRKEKQFKQFKNLDFSKPLKQFSTTSIKKGH